MWADKSVRVGTGLALLLLLAAQEKVCPWLGSPPPGDPLVPAPVTDQKPRAKRPKLPLSLVLRDAAAPRWPASWTQSTLLQTTEVRDGIAGCGPLKNTPPGDSAARPVVGTPLAWHQFLEPAELSQVCVTHAAPASPTDPAVRTCILRTGPPRV